MAEHDSTILFRIESKIDRLGDQISDLAQRVTRLETSEGSRANEVERRFAQLEAKILAMETATNALQTSVDQAQGSISTLKWISGTATAAGGAGAIAAFKTLLGGG